MLTCQNVRNTEKHHFLCTLIKLASFFLCHFSSNLNTYFSCELGFHQQNYLPCPHFSACISVTSPGEAPGMKKQKYRFTIILVMFIICLVVQDIFFHIFKLMNVEELPDSKFLPVLEVLGEKDIWNLQMVKTK